MFSNYLSTLKRLINNARTLIEETTLTDLQRQFAVNIQDEAEALHELLVIIPDFASGNANELLAYDGRSHLNNIIGYAETLLEEHEGELDNYQRSLVTIMHISGEALLKQLNEMVG